MRVALVGYGRWGRRLSAAIDLFAGMDLIAIHARRSIDDQRHIEDYARILGDASIPAVIIAAPTESRPKLIELALRAGKHVLTEKPLSFSPDISHELVALARKSGRALYVDYVHAHSPTVTSLHNLWKKDSFQTLRIGFGQPGPLYEKEGVRQLLLSHLFAIAASIVGNEVESEPPIQVSESCDRNTVMVQYKPQRSVDGTVSLWASTVYPERHRRIELFSDSIAIVAELSNTGKILRSRELASGDVSVEVVNQHSQDRNLEYVFSHFLEACSGVAHDNADLALWIDRCLLKTEQSTG